MTTTPELDYGRILDSSMLNAALAAAKRGWAVFPLHPKSKAPYKGSHGVNDATTDETQIRQWWKQTPSANIALTCGEASGVFVLDVDPRNGGDASLAALEVESGNLPVTVESATGGGGRHLLFRHPGGHVRNSAGKLGKGLDIRGEGGYIVMPPSVHPSGALYGWKRCPDAIALADAPAWLLDKLTFDAGQGGTEKRKQFSVSLSLCPTVDDAIARSLPEDVGQRHRRIFLFARILKATPDYKDQSAGALKSIFARWFERARPIIGTKDFEESWGDFCAAWPRVKHPAGSGPMDEIIEAAKTAELPECAMQYDGDAIRLLVKLCRELQKREGAKPFYLSARTAASAINTRRMTAYRYLAALVADGVLAMVEPGTKTRATRYRFLR